MAKVKLKMRERDRVGFPNVPTRVCGQRIHPGEELELEVNADQAKAIQNDPVFEVLSVSGGGEVTKAELQARLDELGVEYKPKDNKAKLQELIDEAEAGASE